MYAGELVLRCTYPKKCSPGFLDHFPYAPRSFGSDVLHVHAWHTDQFFSTFDYRAGKYNHIRLDETERNTPGGYCHWLAAADIDAVLLAINRESAHFAKTSVELVARIWPVGEGQEKRRAAVTGACEVRENNLP